MKITEETRPEKDSSHLILIPEVFSAYALPFLNEIVLGVVGFRSFRILNLDEKFSV